MHVGEHMSENTFEKISETEFKEIIKPEPIEVIQTLDDLIVKKNELESGIKNNEDQIIFMNAELVKTNDKIAKVKLLGVKESTVES